MKSATEIMEINRIITTIHTNFLDGNLFLDLVSITSESSSAIDSGDMNKAIKPLCLVEHID
jgi:hypothetical protein